MSTISLWRVKLAAWLHDPAEKALVLMRDPGVSHEQGTGRALREKILQPGLGPEERDLARRADRWAAAADRPQFPKELWARVHFASHPELIHPLSGQRFNLQPLNEISAAEIKAVSFDHFDQFIAHGDLRQTALAFWRFGPDTPAGELFGLWDLLPADTRVPDHTIWAHLDLVSAFAGAFALDPAGECALLTVALGPVQDFIAAARKASDLWAGSHLLSTLAWQAMKVVCERLGPDAVLFPNLRGVPVVDAWLQHERGLQATWFAECDWRKSGSDANPLFAASLPNKFVALVPAAQVQEIATAIEAAVRAFALDNASAAAQEMAKAAGAEGSPVVELCVKQLAGFPEVHWAAIPWSLAGDGTQAAALKLAGEPFAAGTRFFSSAAWQLLSKEIRVDGATFFEPNPGTCYPPIYDLLDRLAAAAKAHRGFNQLEQREPRCTLCGERSILADDTRAWEALAKNEPAWAKKNEQLCALCNLKRRWPRLFTAWARTASGIGTLQQYHVSTHTMALATTFGRLQAEGGRGSWGPIENDLKDAGAEPVALPRSLVGDDALHQVFRLLPDALDRDDEEDDSKNPARVEAVRKALEQIGKPENYYAFLLMDGDDMGAWLSGTKEKTLTFGEAWHSQVHNQVAEVAQRNPELAKYLAERRPVSPARHMAISQALHSFSTMLAPFVVETVHKGKLIYAGGDDLMAMVSLDDLLPCMADLRAIYSGEAREFQGLKTGNGFGFSIWRRHEFHLLMGGKATASMGAVIAHFSNPLGRVLRELRAAEHDAKQQPGKNAFSVRLLKRSGGASHLTLPFAHGDCAPITELLALRDAFASPQLSRRAAYHIISQLPLLPPQPDTAMLEAVLGYQFGRQGGKRFRPLGERLAQVAAALKPDAAPGLIEPMLTLAEFLAREGRVGEVEALEATAP